MRWVRTVLWAIAILPLARVAHAEVRNYAITESGGAATCDAKRVPDGYLPNADVGQLTVNVEFPNGTKPAVTDLAVSAGGAKLKPTIQADAATVVLQGGDYKAVHVVVDATFKAKSVHCGEFDTQPTPPAGPASDLDAQRFLTSPKGQAELDEVRKGAGKSTLLLHLPSGRAAFPYPASVSENATLQAVLVADLRRSAGAIFNMDSCPDRDPFRILGDFSALAAKKEGLDSGAPPTEPFAVVAIGASFKCGAGKMVYTAAQAAAPPSAGGQAAVPLATTLRVRPVYHLAATFIYAFDFQNQSTFIVRNKVITSQDDEVGPSLNVGFTWFPGGVDYENMTGRNHWLNPFLVFDLKAPKENFASGLNLTVSGGLSIALGVSAHKSTVLDGKAVGDAFTGDGTVPTRKVWDGKSVGFFVGVALDSAVFGKVKGLWGATTH